jgi:hypothetical protein
MLTFDELRSAIVMMKRAPCRGDEAMIVAQTILKLEAMARAMQEKKPSDDAGTAE